MDTPTNTYLRKGSILWADLQKQPKCKIHVQLQDWALISVRKVWAFLDKVLAGRQGDQKVLVLH